LQTGARGSEGRNHASTARRDHWRRKGERELPEVRYRRLPYI